MTKAKILFTLSVLLSAMGCGPFHMLMPQRLSEEGQKQVDESWNKALTPIDRLNRQSILDAMIATFGWELGVDRLSFRSEKDVNLGTVVMEMRYDRTLPQLDRFAIRVEDRLGHILRQEIYSREEFEKTETDFREEYNGLEDAKKNGTISAFDSERLNELDQRLSRAYEFHPFLHEHPTSAPTTETSPITQP